MIKLTDICDAITQFKKIENNIPLVLYNEFPSLEDFISNFLNICNRELAQCESVKVVFPMFYKLVNWENWETERINSFSFLSRFDGESITDRVLKQLSFSDKKNISFSGEVLKYQNNKNNNGKKNIIISLGSREKVISSNGNIHFVFKTKDVKPNNGILKYNETNQELGIINIDNLNNVDYSDFSYFESLKKIENSSSNKIEEVLYSPALIHTIYLEKDLKIYYIFSNSVTQYSKSYNIKSTYGLGGLFVLMDSRISPKQEEVLLKILENISDRVANRITSFYQLNIIKHHALQSAVSHIINRNYAHHIGSHVSMRSTIDKIIERQTGVKPTDSSSSLLSFVEMENLLTRYKDERNDFIAGIENNNQPITLSFYSDIIRPFIENSLIMDNIAKSEGIYWESEQQNESNGKVKDNGTSKLRIRVFYHKDLSNKNEVITPCIAQKIAHKNCNGSCSNQVEDKSLTLSDLGIVDTEWNEMVAHYTKVNNEGKNLCIHQLPYLKKIQKGVSQFYENIDYTLDDFDIVVPGTLGVHCIYSILENHIRNTAKHADRTFLSNASHMDIIIKISKKNVDYYNIELTSNIPTIRAQDYKSVLKDISTNKLKEPINAEAKSLGFADMRINSTLLAFEKITQENLDKNMMAGVYPKNLKTDNNENSFIYSLKFDFRISKPFKIIFIGDLLNVDESTISDKGYISYKNIKEAINDLIKNPRSFQFAVMDSKIFIADECENAKKDIEIIDYNLLLKHLPWRVLVTNTGIVDNKDLKKLLDNRRITRVDNLDFNSINEPEWLETCWKKWIGNRWKKECDLSIYFQEENTEGATQRYIEAIKIANHFCNPNIIARNDNNNRNLSYKKEKTYIFYDRHGKRGFDSFQVNCSEDGKNPLNDFKNFSWIYLDKNNPDFDRIYLDKLKAPSCSFSKLTESGLHRILVIDERAREYALNKSNHTSTPRISTNKDMNFLEESLLARIYIADSCILNGTEILYMSKIQTDNCSFMQIVLSEKNLEFNSIFFPKDKYVYNGLCPNNNPFDTLIIHRTILNKIFDDKENGENIFSMLSDKFPNILVTTGGGTLSYKKDVMNRIKTVPFFSIKKSLLNGCIAKNLLTNII